LGCHSEQAQNLNSHSEQAQNLNSHSEPAQNLNGHSEPGVKPGQEPASEAAARFLIPDRAVPCF